jgi:hypothetical protein
MNKRREKKERSKLDKRREKKERARQAMRPRQAKDEKSVAIEVDMLYLIRFISQRNVESP